MSSQTETVMEIYGAFGRGDLATILEKLDDKILLEEGVRSTELPYLQPGIGKDHMKAFFVNLASNVEFTTFEPGVPCEGGDTVIVPIRQAGRNLVTGGEIPENTIVHMWTFGPDGKVSAMRHIGDWALHERAAEPVASTPPAVGTTLSVLSDKVSVLNSGGEFEVFDLTGPEGSGPPPHAHPWVESFYVLDGSVEVTTDVTKTFNQGDYSLVPAGVVHTYRILSNEARVLVATSGNRSSLFFADMDANVGPGEPTEESLPLVIEIAKRNGLTSPLFA